MGQPAARQGDHITASDIHIVLVPNPPGQPVPNSLPHPFDGVLAENLSADVRIDGKAAATVGSSATNNPPHMPTPPGLSFTTPPTNKGVIASRLNLTQEHFSRILHELTELGLIVVEGRKIHIPSVAKLRQHEG